VTSSEHAALRSRDALSRVVLAGLGVAGAAFFVYALATRWSGTWSSDLRFQPAYLAVAALFIAAAVATIGFTWKLMLDHLGGRASERPVQPLLRAFFYSWLGRYIPGTVPFLLMRVEMTQRAGYRRGPVAASLAYENVLQLATALALSLALLIATMGRHADSFALYGLLLVPLAGAALIAQPRVLLPVLNRVARRLGRDEVDAASVLPGRAIAAAVALYCLFVVLNGVGFYFALLAVTPARPEYLPAAIGIYNLAGVIGVLAVFVPSGLGVREGVIIALVSLQFPIEVAAGAAVLSRVAAATADGLPAACLFAHDGLRRLRG
jgi:uncharacterized membrane protein YbhN (UPF0104 family)